MDQRLLNHDETEILIYAVQNNIRRQEALSVLIEKNMGLCHMIARKFARSDHLDDAVAVAIYSMHNAIDKFDPALGFKFSTFAFHLCSQSVQRYVATYQNAIRIPEHFTYKMNRIRKIWTQLSEDDRDPSVTDLSKVSGLPIDMIEFGMECMRVDPVSFDDPLNVYLIGKTYDQYDLGNELIHSCIERLPVANQVVIACFLESEKNKKIISDISNTLKVTRSEARSMLNESLANLKECMGSHQP